MTDRLVSVIVTTGRGPLTEFALVNLRHFWTPLYAPELVLNSLILICWVVTGRIRRCASVFAVHGGANLAPLFAARILRIPVVWHFHETTPRFRRLVGLGRWLLRRSPHVLTVVANKSSEVYGLSAAVLLPASVDNEFWSRDKVSQEEFSSSGWKTTPNCGPQPLRLLAIGNLNPLKGFDVLLEALTGISRPWHLQIVGAALATHRDYAEKLNLHAVEIARVHPDSQIDFLGWKSRNSVRALLATCDVFILPSRSEACPIALLEAMSMGCRCVAADVGDVKLMMENYPSSAVFPVEAADACRTAILEIVKSEGGPLLNVGEIGPAWQIDKIARKAEAIYRGLLDQVDQ